MNNVFKYALIVFGLNALLYVLCIMITAAFGDNLEVALTLLLLVPIIILLGELIVGAIFAGSKTKKDLGYGLLIGFGITLVIGFSVCGLFIGI